MADVLSYDNKVGLASEDWYQRSAPISESIISSETRLGAGSNTLDLQIETLDSRSIEGLKQGTSVTMILRTISDGWVADVSGTRISEFGDTQDMARESAIDTIEALKEIYLDEPDDALTADAIELREWLSSIF